MPKDISPSGKKRRRTRFQDRGRQVDAAALTEIQELLDGKARNRNLLIEHLHIIQDTFNQISERHLAALAREMNIPMAEAYEVATFYAHFDVRKDHEVPLPKLTVRVCDSLSCQLRGAESLLEEIQKNASKEEVHLVRAPCVGRCDLAPVVEVGHNYVDQATCGKVTETIASGHFSAHIPDYQDLEAYRLAGGYTQYLNCKQGDSTPEQVIEAVDAAGLKGMGGAGFRTALKFKYVRMETEPRLMVVNADEGEPGTFKDRLFMEQSPHQVLEGMLIAGWVVAAEKIYFYLRDEYPAARTILTQELDALVDAGIIDSGYVELRRGAGAYICGEESALIESIEGKRGYPRQRPPYVAQVGLFGQPTLVNNVETLYWIPRILEKGATWFADQGANDSVGPRSYSVSGRVANPGVKIAPAGISVQDLINQYCGGMELGHQLLGYLPGGASGGILPANKASLPLDFGKLEEHGCLIGSAAVIVLSDQDDLKAVALNLMRFFEDESCGQCTPCRSGTEKIVALLEKGDWNMTLLNDLSQVMADASICGLGQAAANPIQSLFRDFPEVIIASSGGGA